MGCITIITLAEVTKLVLTHANEKMFLNSARESHFPISVISSISEVSVQLPECQEALHMHAYAGKQLKI